MSTPGKLTVYRHETLAPLAKMLAHTMAATTYPDPLTKTVVAVPSFAVARWLTDQLARSDGGVGAHVANLLTPFPATLIDELLVAVLADGADGLYQPERLMWTILYLLRRDLATEPCYEPLKAQLTPRAGQQSGLAFARHSAELFDRYIRHRPELLDRWQAGQNSDRRLEPLAKHLRWQPVLWRAITDTLSEDPPHVRLKKAITRLSHPDTAAFADVLADRYRVFGVHALPVSELALFDAVARHREVTLYLLTPSRTWLFGSELTLNNRSLEVFTRHAQAQHRQVQQGLTNATVIDLDETTRPTTALGVVQQHLRTDTPPTPATRAVLLPADNSVSVHACQGLVRECDAVKDRLLGLLDADETLALRDIAIVTPDLARIAPLIAGVLADGDQPGEQARNYPQLPFAIKDRSVAKANPLAETLTQLFTLAQSRVTLSQIADLLHREVVCAQLELNPAEVSAIVALLRAAGVRWGIDGAHRFTLSGVDDPVGSFAYGFDRIVLGLAVPNQGERVVFDVSPYAALSTEDMQQFLTVLSFLTDVFQRITTWRGPKTLNGWVDETVQVLDTLLQPAPDAFQQQTDTDTIAQIVGRLAEAAGEHAELEVSLTEFMQVFHGACAKHGVAGTSDIGITVSSLHGIRGLPFRVVCLVGMNDHALAGAPSDVVHDLIATQPDINDVTMKEETRQLVFDALMQASDHLIITYTATDPRTGERNASARILDDLNELFATHLTMPDESSVLDAITHTHPRQLTNPTYYDPQSPLLRTDRALLDLARPTQKLTPTDATRAVTAPRFHTTTPLGAIEPITLPALSSALQDPSRAYLYRHGIQVVADVDAPDDRDLFTLDGLARYAVYDEVMAWRDELTLDAFVDAAMPRGVLPTGSFGRRAKHQLHRFVADLKHHRSALANPPSVLEVRLDFDGFALTGEVTRHADTIVGYDASSNPISTELAVWLSMLAASVQTGVPHQGIVMFRAQQTLATHHFEAPSDGDACYALLAQLVALQRTMTATPIPLFARTSSAYAAKLQEGKDVDEALTAAEKHWFSAYSGLGDATKAAVRFVYGIDLPFARVACDKAFHQLATDVFTPLIDARVKDGS